MFWNAFFSSRVSFVRFLRFELWSILYFTFVVHSEFQKLFYVKGPHPLNPQFWLIQPHSPHSPFVEGGGASAKIGQIYDFRFFLFVPKVFPNNLPKIFGVGPLETL